MIFQVGFAQQSLGRSNGCGGSPETFRCHSAIGELLVQIGCLLDQSRPQWYRLGFHGAEQALYAGALISRVIELVGEFENMRWGPDSRLVRRIRLVCRYGLASGAPSTALQAGGRAAIVIGGFGLGGVGDGLGWRIESLNQKARSPALQPSPSEGSG